MAYNSVQSVKICIILIKLPASQLEFGYRQYADATVSG